MRGRPKLVVILGTNYEVKYMQPSEMKNLCGDADFELKRIRINAELSPSELESTLLHEIIHVILHQSGMAYLISSKMDEALTRALENGLYPLVTFRARKAGVK